MTQTISAHFDGRILVPHEPIDLPPGRRLRIQVDLATEPEPRFADLLGFAADLPGAPADLAAQHDHYLTGTPKR